MSMMLLGMMMPFVNSTEEMARLSRLAASEEGGLAGPRVMDVLARPVPSIERALAEVGGQYPCSSPVCRAGDARSRSREHADQRSEPARAGRRTGNTGDRSRALRAAGRPGAPQVEQQVRQVPESLTIRPTRLGVSATSGSLRRGRGLRLLLPGRLDGARQTRVASRDAELADVIGLVEGEGDEKPRTADRPPERTGDLLGQGGVGERAHGGEAALPRSEEAIAERVPVDRVFGVLDRCRSQRRGHETAETIDRNAPPREHAPMP